jgi:hypothetical protein
MRTIKDLVNKIREPQVSDDVKNFMPKSSSGTEIFSGEFFEEYLDEIRGKEWSIRADKMRRSSDQINMLLQIIKTPIINATWDIEYDETTDQGKEIKEFTEFALFENIDFKQFLEEALTFFEFGHSVFEKVFTPVVENPKYSGAITIKKFSFINPKTIEEWNLNKYDGSLKNVRQVVDGDLNVDVEIDAENLLMFSIGREGSNYEGRSLLRPIYGNWKRKQALLKTLAIGIERASLGVPVGVTSASASKGARTKLQGILNSFTSHQRSSIVVPHGTEVKNFEISFDPEKVQEVIRAERLGMSQSFLAGFMDLGTNSSSGSFALSNNLMNIFLSSIQLYADKISYQVDNVIKDIVDFNFGKQEKYPKMNASNIVDKLGKDFIEILQILTQSGYVSATDTMKDYLRKKFNLPEDDMDEQGIVEPNDPNTPDPQPAPPSTELKEIELATKSKANKQIENDRDTLEKEMIKALTARRDKLLNNTRKILNKNSTKSRRKEVLAQEIPNSSDYRKMIADSLVDSSATATRQVQGELGIANIQLADKEDVNVLTSDTKSRIRSEVDLIVDTQDSDLKKNLFFSFNNNVDNTDSTEKLIEQMKEGSDRFINGPSVSVGAANFVSNAVNNARNDVYHTPEILDSMESFTITNPSPKAAICKELAGRTITKEQYINGDLPPYHHNCNTIVVANVNGAKGNPKINPLGLSFTGSQEQVEKIIKSNTL